MNGTGAIVMAAQRVGADTLLAQIVRLVGEAQRSRAPIQRLADVVAGWFVPAVIASAIATCAVWAFYGPEPRLAHREKRLREILPQGVSCRPAGFRHPQHGGERQRHA